MTLGVALCDEVTEENTEIVFNINYESSRKLNKQVGQKKSRIGVWRKINNIFPLTPSCSVVSVIKFVHFQQKW